MKHTVRIGRAVLTAVFVLASCSSRPTDLGDGVEPLDAGHAAALILEGGATDFVAFSKAASEQQSSFVCATGAGPHPWELCLVADNGVLAIIPFNAGDGVTATIGDAMARLDTDHAVGVPHPGTSVSVDIEYRGEKIGSVSTPGDAAD